MAEPKSSHKQRLGLLFNQELTTNLISVLFGVYLFTACRINEAYTLHVIDVYDTKARVRPYLIIRKGNTKGKLAIRTTALKKSEHMRESVNQQLDPLDWQITCIRFAPNAPAQNPALRCLATRKAVHPKVLSSV
ncbi:hypothetical protein [Chlorogloea sp. CCALA 695]|uniref:hypothetical protein n=1 Tax=Chlorogloea sp. CCALA 695 TaxID=2107693 RepID=UPI0018EC4881|nr:hypothetical protein [Chlorogloea sp. CCALA 695]